MIMSSEIENSVSRSIGFLRYIIFIFAFKFIFNENENSNKFIFLLGSFYS